MNAGSVEAGDFVRVYNAVGKVIEVFLSGSGEEIYDVQHHRGRVAALEADILINYGKRPVVASYANSGTEQSA
jgi:hypothetical protein